MSLGGRKTTGRVNRGKVRQRLNNRQRRRLDAESLNYTEGVLRRAYVVGVNAANMAVDIQLIQGPNTQPFRNVPISFGHTGSRSFMGVMPQLNDQCIVGFAPSTLSNTRPYIVAWVPSAPRMGVDWNPVALFSGEEVEPTLRTKLTAGPYAPVIRFKGPRLEEGNAFISSAQGSDLILTESAVLTNRRGSEIHLRDQDQALILRSQQQFHAGSGFRVYAGIAQRDVLIPAYMLFAQQWWSGWAQKFSDGRDLPSWNMPTDYAPMNSLMTAPIFQRAQTGERLFSREDTPTGHFNPWLDPYTAYARGGFVNSSGDLIGRVSDSIYNGTVVNQVGSTGQTNPYMSTGDGYSEYRIEVSYEDDGTLPVTEQTDGFDVDRLPLNPPSVDSDSGDVQGWAQSPKMPDVEMVLGTYIGNRPFGTESPLYGLPVVPQIYNANGTVSPGLVSAAGKPESEQAAWMVVVRSVDDPDGEPSWMAITKGGAFRSHFSGAGSDTAQTFYSNGQTIAAGGSGLTLEANEGSLDLVHGDGANADGFGITLETPAAVLIHGTAPSTVGSAASPAAAAKNPAVHVKSDSNTKIESAKTTNISSPEVIVDNCESEVHNVTSAIKFKSGDQFAVNAKSGNFMYTGDCSVSYGGKRDGLPLNGCSLTETFSAKPATGILGAMPVHEKSVQFGSSSTSGISHKEEWESLVGAFEVQATGTSLPGMGFGSGLRLGSGIEPVDNSITVSPTTGMASTAFVGNLSFKAVAGGASIVSTLPVQTSTPSPTTVTTSLATLAAPGIFMGAGISDGCIDSLTGRPFLSSGTVGYSTVRFGA